MASRGMLDFSLNIKEMSWVENTEAEVDFVVEALGLTGSERILDLACGFGRHCLELSRRGYAVVGVDIEPALIADARQQATLVKLDVTFLQGDILELDICEQFDVVLNLADGAIGYFATEADNLKLFDVLARALRPGGRHVMATCSASHARKHFPKRHWEAGSRTLSLADFSWKGDTSRMIYRGHVLRFGEALAPIPDRFEDEGQLGLRLYDLDEIARILGERGMTVTAAYGGYTTAVPASADRLMQVVCSTKSPPHVSGLLPEQDRRR